VLLFLRPIMEEINERWIADEIRNQTAAILSTQADELIGLFIQPLNLAALINNDNRVLVERC